MKIIKRKMLVTHEIATANDNIDQYLPYCQASFNSDGNITLRNYDRSDKSKDEIIILSEAETGAIMKLMSQLSSKIKSYRHKENCLYNRCSICSYEHCREDNYCPNCGAKMDGKPQKEG